jgi:predicted dehydrogenase
MANIETFSGTVCKVAIVGAGYMAREHIRAFQDMPGVEIVGIHSRTRSKAESFAKEFGLRNVCDSIPELFEKTKADLVVVTVSSLATNEICRACFEYPWTVLIEKPAGYDVPDAEAIEANALKKKRNAYVALNRRHYGATRTVVSDLAGLSGTRFIKVQDQQSQALALQLGHPQLIVDNWFYACSIHVIDYFLLLGRGKITEVSHVIRWNPKQPRYVVAKISFDSGDVGLYEAIWDGPGPWAVTVNTPEKRWEMRPLEKAAFQLAGKRVLEPVADDPQDIQFKAGLRRQAELAVSAAMGKPQAELPTLHDALASMRLTQAIYS